MAVRPDIALPDPAIIGARFVGTVRMMGVDCSWASSRGCTQQWRGERGLVAGLLAVLTGLAGGPFGQASKRRGDFGRSCGPLREGVLRRQALRPRPIGDHQLPEHREEHELVKKRVAYHLSPFPFDRTEVCYLFSELMNYPHAVGTRPIFSSSLFVTVSTARQS